MAWLTFLDPTAGIVAGTAGGLALLCLYLLRLRRRPVRVSSTLLWRKSVADLQVNVPFRWLRLSWMFVLQVLIVSCFALALARPAASGGVGAGKSVIVLVDCSASMSAVDASGRGGVQRSRLEEAREQALDVIDRLSAGAEGMVVSFAAGVAALTSMTRDRGLLRRVVREIEATDQPGSLERVLEFVRAATGPVSEERSREATTVVLISDGGFPGGVVDAGAGLGEARFIRVGPTADQDGGVELDNVGIVAMSVRRDYADPATVRLFVRLQSVVGRGLDVPVTCRVDDRVVDRRTVSMPAGSASSPGEASATIEFQNTEGGLVVVSIGRGDSLASDDAAAAVLRPARAVRIVLVRRDGEVSAAGVLLEAALEALEPASLTVMTETEYRASAGSPKGRTHTDEAADLVVFDGVRPERLPASASLSFGAGLPVPGLVVRGEEEQDQPEPTGFVYWLRTHPVMRYVALNGIWVDRPAGMTLPEGEGRDGSAVSATALASGRIGPMIALVESAGVRRVVVGFDLARSNWIRDAGFHVFLKNVVDYLTLTGESEAGTAWRTTDVLNIRPARGARRLDIAGPVSLTREIGEASAGQRVSIGPVPLAGVYRINGAVDEDSVVAVNLLDPNESAIAVRDAVSIGGESVGSARASALGRREVWHWFILAAVALACVEWMLYAWRMRV